MSKEYTSWAGMVDRCCRENSQHFDLYGGRGITVCDRWRHSFENFLADMGPKPTTKHSIDRIDVNGNYEPSNCRWATQNEQMRNTRITRMMTIGDETKSVADWAEGTGLDHKTIIDRLDHGVDPLAAMTLGRYEIRNPKTYTHNGETRTILEWARFAGMTRGRLDRRLRMGWPIELAIVPPTPGKRSYAPGVGRWAVRADAEQKSAAPRESSGTGRRK